MRYYPIQKRWNKIKPFVKEKAIQDILVRDFNKYTKGMWGTEFKHGMTPHDVESCDWWCDHKGRMPEYWNYVKHAACHWLANFCLEIAKRIEPKRQWRIVTSQEHSTRYGMEKKPYLILILWHLALNLMGHLNWHLRKK